MFIKQRFKFFWLPLLLGVAQAAVLLSTIESIEAWFVAGIIVLSAGSLGFYLKRVFVETLTDKAEVNVNAVASTENSARAAQVGDAETAHQLEHFDAIEEVTPRFMRIVIGHLHSTKSQINQ